MAAEPRLCVECGEPQVRTRKTVPYPQSGLPNVQLLNVPVWTCPHFHEEVEIPSPKELHEVLARLVMRKPASLVGAELRFLRRRTGLSAKDFAERIGLTPVRLSQLENSTDAVARRTDLLIRLYVAAAMTSRTGAEFPKDLAPLLDELESGTWDLGEHRVRHTDEADSESEWEAASA